MVLLGLMKSCMFLCLMYPAKNKCRNLCLATRVQAPSFAKSVASSEMPLESETSPKQILQLLAVHTIPIPYLRAKEEPYRFRK